MRNIVYTRIETDYKGRFYVRFKPFRSSHVLSDEKRFDTKKDAQKRASWLYFNWED